MIQKQKKKKLGEAVRAGQRLMNGFGFTDRLGRSLKVDGVLGTKTGEALSKLKRYQEELERPSTKTRAVQTELNKSGRKYLDGKPLKVDGVFGPKTDYVQNIVDNNFTGWLMDDNFKERALPTKTFPKMPKIGKGELEKIVKGEWADLEKQEPTKIESRIPGMGAARSADGWKQAGLPDLTKQPASGIKTQPESAFEKAYKTLEDKITNKSALSHKPEGQKTMERRLPGSYMGTQKEQDDITGLQALIEEAAGKQKNGTQADGMVYNMGNESAGKIKLMNGVPQPTKPPQGTGSEGGASWQDEWNATPQYGDAGKPSRTKEEIDAAKLAEQKAYEEEQERRKQNAITDTEEKMQKDGFIDLSKDKPEENLRNIQYVNYLLGYDTDDAFDEKPKGDLKTILGDSYDSGNLILTPQNLEKLKEYRKGMEKDVGDVEKIGKIIDTATKGINMLPDLLSGGVLELVAGLAGDKFNDLINPRKGGWVE